MIRRLTFIAALLLSGAAQAAYNVPVPTTLLTGTLQAPQFPALSGDCTTTAGAFAVLCGKTGGVTFAPSATVDTTNATNISSGTLAVARLPLGVTNGAAAAAGVVGEVMAVNVPVGSAVTATSTVPLNITSITLTPGDWNCWGFVGSNPLSGTITSLVSGGLTLTSAVSPAIRFLDAAVPVVGGDTVGSPVPQLVVNVSASTPVFLVGQANFTTSTMSMYGQISCRRMR